MMIMNMKTKKNNKNLIISDGCCVQYGDTLALDNVTFSVNKGKKVAVVGPNGGGKSTLFNAMTGLIPLANGSLKIYGEDPKEAKKKIGYIPQNIVILNQSLKENILFGSNPKFFDNKKIINILKAVELDYFLKKLPKGLNQIIKEDGQNISGGEKQRIGIARALLKNPKILILDEATSGLDTFTESKVLDTINKIKKTIVIVSHRINTLKFCDKVYSIKNNTLKEINISQLN